MKKSVMKWMKSGVVALGMAATCILQAGEKPLTIAYSDWPGWVAWDIAEKKGFFKEQGVDVKLLWFEYGASMDAFASGKVDSVCVANGDAMVLNATGARNIMVMVNDFSNGNDKIVAAKGISSVKELKGKKVGVEIGCLSHELLMKALQDNGMSEKDVKLVNMPTHQAVQTLESGGVDAVVAWQPHSGMALKTVEGAKAVYTSANAPGLIYDTLAVSPESLLKNKAEWKKVVDAWYMVVDYLKDPANEKEALDILSARVGISPKEYKKFLSGTRILSRKEAQNVLKRSKGFDTLFGSSTVVNEFFVSNKVYDKAVNVKRCIDPSLTK